MKIIQKHHCKGLLNRSLRKFSLIFYAAILISVSLLIYSMTEIILGDGSFVPSIIYGVILIVAVLILTSVTKSRRDIQLKQDQSRYRFDEIEFGDDCVSGRDYCYYISGGHSIKYQSIKKICFTKQDVYIFFLNMLAIAFSRADMTEAEETALTELLTQKLPAGTFNASKIPERNTVGCKEIRLIPEKEIVSLFPETAVSYKASRADVRFALTHNYVSGKESNPRLRAIIWGIAVLLSAGVWITGSIIAEDFLSSLGLIVFTMAAFGLALQTIILTSIIITEKSLEKITSNEIVITDYFLTYKINYGDGTFLCSAYNLAGFMGIVEFRDYFLFAPPGGVIAAPKAVFYNLDTLRQIFAKELGPKFRGFPDK